MTQRAVERIIGKLATDEEIRHLFRRAPRETLEQAVGESDLLTTVERDALVSIDPEVLDRFADSLDPRIQRVRIPRGAHGGRSS
jgi:hypothetical protein